MSFTPIQTTLKGRQIGLTSGGALVLNLSNGHQVVLDQTGITDTSPAGATTVIGGGGSGTLTATSGALTASAIVLGNGTIDTKVVAGITTDAVSKLNLGVIGASVGGVVFANLASGTITLQPATGVLGSRVLSLPAATDTLVGQATADTLTNKVISGASNTLTVRLANDVTGNLPVANLGSGTGATATTYWSGNGTWSTPSGAGTGTVTAGGGALTANRMVLGNGTIDTKVAAGLTTDGVSVMTLGVAGTSAGGVNFNNATSGQITLAPPTGALGSVALVLPSVSGTLAVVNPPVTLIANTSLTKAAHANRTIYANSASALTLTVNNDSTSGMGSDDYFYVVPSGGGLHTLAAGTATITQPAGTILGSATSPFAVQHKLAADNYVCTEEFATYPHFALTDAAPIAVDASKVNFSLTMVNNRTLQNPTNLVDGAILNFWITQDGTGNRTLAFDTKYAAAGGIGTIILSTAIGAVDFLSMQYNLAKDKLVVTILKAVA